MKKIYFFLVCLLGFLVFGCEEVIPLELQTAPPKLVVEAPILWEKGTDGSDQSIRLSTTTSFYNSSPIRVSGATVFIKNSSNTTFTFTEFQNTGVYNCFNFVPQIGENYTLTIISNGMTYTASETLQSVAPIARIEQNNTTGLSGKEIQIKTYYNDPAKATNFYLYNYTYSTKKGTTNYVEDDTFFNGNEFFSISQEDKLKAGDKIRIEHLGISKTYYNYMSVLVNIAGDGGGRPFQATPVTVRGNVINTTQPDNFALGYFSVNESDTREYIVK